MTPLLPAGATLTAVALGALLVAERRRLRWAIWLAKPVASLGFVMAALGAGAVSSAYGRLVLAGLALCWLGDVLLIPAAKGAFLAGLASFLAGHVAFALAFVLRGIAPLAAVVTLAALLLPALGVWRWLGPHVPAPMRVPVVAYVVVIVLMVTCAVGTLAPLPIAGALAFFVSDLSVARDRFVSPGFANRAWGLPLYYAAVTLLAISTA